MTAFGTSRHVLRGSERQVWMDVLRGLAVVLIVVLHSSTLVEASGVTPSATIARADAALQPFRIPMLMLLSGMLLPAALAKPAGRYLLGKARAILWPFVLWSVLVAVTFTSVGLDSLPLDLVAPDTYLWYLHALLVAYAVALVVRRIPEWLTAPAAFVAAVVLDAVELPAPFATFDLVRAVLFVGYFLAGSLIARQLPRLDAVLDRWPVIAALLCVAGALAALSALGVVDASTDEPLLAPAVLVSIVGVVALARAVPLVDPVSRTLASIGKESIVPYVLHWFTLVAVLPMVIAAVGPGRPALVQAIAVGITLVVAVAIARLARDVRPVGWLFRL